MLQIIGYIALRNSQTCEGVFYFESVVRLHSTRENVISFTPIKHYGFPLSDFRDNYDFH